MDDLRDPAEAITTCCQTLLAETEGTLTEQQQEFIQTIMNNSQRFTHQTFSLQDQIEQMRAGTAFFEIGHELRSPLTTIFGYNHLLLNGMVGELNAQQQQHLRQIDEIGNALKNAIDRLFENASHTQDDQII
ncbi:MAG: hypothetical protein H7Y09_09560 [Chitinophagaceae bacterium]|nr:hypothetical protein [Anaerolineae bacterium]